MKYVGIATQQRKNNVASILLLIAFPIILLGMVWLFLAVICYFGNTSYDAYGNVTYAYNSQAHTSMFAESVPWVLGGVVIWFLIAYFSNTTMIRKATGAQPLERKDNPRIYNIVENLCMACGMDMPKVNIIDDRQLNAFASGIDKNSYTVTLTTGIINRLDDDELAGVIGHELTHIRNHDTRLLITSIIFVGIVATLTSVIVRIIENNIWFGGFNVSTDNSDRRNGGGLSAMAVLLIALVISAIGYFFTLITRFAISRKREYMADAGGAELCGNPHALASALRKISANPGLGNVGRDDIAQLYIIHPHSLGATSIAAAFSQLFSTHPSTESRIAYLEQF